MSLSSLIYAKEGWEEREREREREEEGEEDSFGQENECKYHCSGYFNG